MRGHAVKSLMESPVLQGEDELVGIRESELDAVGVFQFLSLDALAVQVHPMAAVEVFEEVLALLQNDLRMLTRDAAVAQDQVVVPQPAHPERQRL